jgi:hypothetical protein
MEPHSNRVGQLRIAYPAVNSSSFDGSDWGGAKKIEQDFGF